MKKFLSLTVITTALFSVSFLAKAQVHYAYTYYDHPYELPSLVTTAVHDLYPGCQMVRARSFYNDDHLLYSLVFRRNDSFEEVFVNHRGYVTKRVLYTYNPVTHIWVSPNHHHYDKNGHHHKNHYNKHHHGHYHKHMPANARYDNDKMYMQRDTYKKHRKAPNESRYDRNYVRRSGVRKSTERAYSYARR